MSAKTALRHLLDQISEEEAAAILEHALYPRVKPHQSPHLGRLAPSGMPHAGAVVTQDPHSSYFLISFSELHAL